MAKLRIYLSLPAFPQFSKLQTAVGNMLNESKKALLKPQNQECHFLPKGGDNLASRLWFACGLEPATLLQELGETSP